MVIDHDWAATPLGAEPTWSPTLRTAVSTALNSRFAMLLMWGPELVMVYNDAYAPALGYRHPSALGKRVPDVWVDVWADIKGMVDEVYAGGATYFEDLPLTMTRHGFTEECYFTFSYSPVVEPGGTVAGLLNTVAETTQRVLATRRLSVLQQLGSLPRSVQGNAGGGRPAALRVLAGARADCPFGLVYLVDEDAGEARLVADHGIGVEGELAGSVIPEQVRDAIATGGRQTVTGLAGPCPGSPARGEPGRSRTTSTRRSSSRWAWRAATARSARVVLGTSPHLRLDDDYRTFLTLAAGQVAAAVADAQAVEAERRRAEERAQHDSARAQFFTDVAVTLQRAVLGPPRCPTASPSTTSRPPAPWRSAATGTTSSTCPTVSTGSSSVTSSGGDSPPPR